MTTAYTFTATFTDREAISMIVFANTGADAHRIAREQFKIGNWETLDALTLVESGELLHTCDIAPGLVVIIVAVGHSRHMITGKITVTPFGDYLTPHTYSTIYVRASLTP